MTSPHLSDILIIGSGLAGLGLAIHLSENSQYSINVITKRNLNDSNTNYAQGGIAAAISEDDSIEQHIEDTLITGNMINRRNVVEEIIKGGPEAIEFLKRIGVKFDEDEDHNISLGREGGHLQRRVAHVHDLTGQAIQNSLIDYITNHPQITIFENHTAIDLVYVDSKIAGAYVLDNQTHEVLNFSAKITVLASGGSGKVFLYTSNPDIASGDGLAMAYRAGATVVNMEFVQFHPTLYYNSKFKNFLISETLRGEGAILTNMTGTRFMPAIHELAELAPRDVVARAIDHEMKRTGQSHAYLDISHVDSDRVKEHFKQIYYTLMEYGLDITKEPIPIVPAAHYTIGGIQTTVAGETSIPNLYAVGEVCYTGLHGANRLASNSLLEAVIMGKRASASILNTLTNKDLTNYSFSKWQSGAAVELDEVVIMSNNWAEIRHTMWNYVGIVRTTKRLLRAKKRIQLLVDEVQEYYWKYHVTPEIIELRNVVLVASLIVDGAIARKESVGVHYTLDFPEENIAKRDTLNQKIYGIHYSEEFFTEL